MPSASQTRLDARIRDLTGTKVGTLVAERYLGTKATGNAGRRNMALWEVRCEACGNIEVKERRGLVAKTAKCSVCSRRVRNDLTGRRFGRWLVVALAPATGGQTEYRCRCDCGTSRVLRADYLVSGESRSCGCLFEEVNEQVLRKARKARWRKRR